MLMSAYEVSLQQLEQAIVAGKIDERQANIHTFERTWRRYDS